MRKFFAIIFSVAALASCKDMLNIAPGDEIISDNMWTTESLADKGMAGLYRNFYAGTPSTSRIDMTSGGIDGIDRQSWIALEFQSFSSSSSQVQLLINATKNAGSYAIQYDWEWCYTGIHRINDAIENLYKAPIGTEKYERYMCEAKFLRAWYYSRLNMIYQGVPIYLRVISEEECTEPQASSAEVWQVVLNDLNDCIENENFPDNTLANDSDYGRASKGAAYSLRGMAYMYLAWENGDEELYYRQAIDDFEKVAECGYGLWDGEYIDFFADDANEKNKEMIFPIQFELLAGSGVTDYIDAMFGTKDTYGDWTTFRPTFDFVSYFQNSDGSKFDWANRIDGWNDSVFTNDVSKREVFFLRNSITLENGSVVRDHWDETEAAAIQERVNIIGTDIFEKYYDKDWNEDRIKSCFENRDPRLKQIVLTPYEQYNTYNRELNDGKTCYNKELRWPLVSDYQKDGDDINIGNTPYNTYIYKKFVHNEQDPKGLMTNNAQIPNDYPLIRYTDVYLHLAECYAHIGRLSAALSIVNEIRNRAHMPNVSANNFEDVMEAIRYERRIELCCEGVTYFDEWRWGTYKEMKFNGNDVYSGQCLWGQWKGFSQDWYYTDNMYPWSAPSAECQKNPNIKVRDGWSL